MVRKAVDGVKVRDPWRKGRGAKPAALERRSATAPERRQGTHGSCDARRLVAGPSGLRGGKPEGNRPQGRHRGCGPYRLHGPGECGSQRRAVSTAHPIRREGWPSGRIRVQRLEGSRSRPVPVPEEGLRQLRQGHSPRRDRGRVRGHFEKRLAAVAAVRCRDRDDEGPLEPQLVLDCALPRDGDAVRCYVRCYVRVRRESPKRAFLHLSL